MDTHEKVSDTIHKELHIDQELAAIANQEEDETSKWQAIRKELWAFIWCLYAVWTVLLVSFENQACGSILSIPEFRMDFGSFYNGTYVLESKWQSAFNGAPVASQVVGTLFGGQVAAGSVIETSSWVHWSSLLELSRWSLLPRPTSYSSVASS